VTKSVKSTFLAFVLGNNSFINTLKAKPSNMKKSVPSLTALLCLLFFFNFCALSKNLIESKPGIETPKEGLSCFVELKDGSIKQYTSLELVTGVFKTPHLLADGNIVIKAEEIMAYQNKEYYAISQKKINSLKPSKVAVDALPGFAIRVAKGKLNVYSLKYYNGHNTTQKFYLQAGEEGNIVLYTPELLNELVKDSNEAYSYFNDKNKDAAISDKLLATIDIYNNSKLISKN
jgi:hypothetical protein